MPDHKFTCSDRLDLQSGDIIALLTDGITEAERPDQEEFGIERALEYIRAHRHKHVQLIINGLYKAVRDFSDGLAQVDDITAVLCKVE